ncbi:MAG: SufS family cysteine desulfurase [Proteobacteria bacterium]|nr:SufS family cysteine desulfurase [Pseudomonadota bacterium]
MKEQFPLLANHPDLVYLDSAATSQKPQCVIERMQQFYTNENANVHRGVYELSEKATLAFEQARIRIARTLNASPEVVIFTRGTTDAINLVASSLGQLLLQPDDEILLTAAEHHSNIVPWQLAAARFGAKIRYIPLDQERRLDMAKAAQLINKRTKIMAFAHISNVLGIEHPVRELIKLAKSVGAVTLIDGAQGIAHKRIDVRELDCDFYAFSGHKVFGPTGIGVLYGRRELLNRMPPYQGGGDMIERVTLEGSTWNELPSKFEAGTPHIAGAIGLGAAFEFLEKLDMAKSVQHDRQLGLQLLDIFKREFPRVQLMLEPGPDWIGIVTFSHNGIHPHDLAAVCDSEKVCIRAGHHCAQPLMNILGVPATARVAPFLYNDENDINRFVAALRKAEKLFC